MAREATDLLLAVERRLVDVVDHRDHLARDQLLRLAVDLALVRVVVVAIRAADAERGLEEDHRRVEHVGRLAVQRLDVLETLFDLLIAALRGHLLLAGEASI